MRHQRGISLISTLVGLVLSIIAVTALMVAYRSIVQNAISSSANAKTGATSASGLLSMEQGLAQAGWGDGASNAPPGGSVNINLVLLSGASLANGLLSGNPVTIGTAATSGNALVWDTQVSGQRQCLALLSAAGGTVQLLGPVACAGSAVSQWNAVTWSTATPLVQVSATNTAPFSAQSQTTCWPYQFVPTYPQAMPTTYAQVTLSGFQSSSPAVCLPNIPH